MAKEFKLSAKRLEELQEELNYLKTTREKEVAEMLDRFNMREKTFFIFRAIR